MKEDLGFVLRTVGTDCSRGGCTSKFEFLFVFPKDAKDEDIENFVTNHEKNNTGGKYDVTREKCVRICQRENGYVYAEVVFKRPDNEGPYMAGGNYIHSSNANFIDMVGHSYPISVHDRFESWQMYEAMSI